MAISNRSVGSWATPSTSAQASVSVTLPAHQAGDMILVRATRKPYTNPDDITIDQGFAAVAAGYNNGTTANGNGTGSMAFKAFCKEAASSSEANPTVTWGDSAAPGSVVAIVYQKGASEGWVTPVGAGGPHAIANGINVTISSHVSVVAGDMVDFFSARCDDSAAMTVPQITQAGVTFDTVTEAPAAALASGNSNDMAADGGYRLATAGTSSAAAVVTGTAATAEQGGAWQTRLRVVELHSASVVATGGGVLTPSSAKRANSANVATGAGALTPSSGKRVGASPVMSGGGVMTVARSTTRTASPIATGGGIATVAAGRIRDASVTATGGGVAIVSAAKRATVTALSTGGGVATVAQTTIRTVAPLMSGGGVAVVASAKRAAASLVASGSGIATLDPRTRRLLDAVMTGGGVATVDGEAAGGGDIRSASVFITGGGVATVSPAKRSQASATMTGAGVAMLAGTKRALASVLASGGGAASTDATTTRTASPTVTGGGIIPIDAETLRLASVLVTGAGVATVDDVAIWGSLSAPALGDIGSLRPGIGTAALGPGGSIPQLSPTISVNPKTPGTSGGT